MKQNEGKQQSQETKTISDLSVYARRYRMAQTLFMPFINICTGLNVAILTPTIIDMTRNFHTQYDSYSQALMVKSWGILFGGWVGGLFIDRFKSRVSLFIAVNMLLSGAATALMPAYPNLILLGFLCLIQGLTKGCTTTAASSYIMAIWGKQAPVPIHILHTAATAGSVIGPLMSQPFISSTNKHSANCTVSTESTSQAPTTVSSFSSVLMPNTTSWNSSTGMIPHTINPFSSETTVYLSNNLDYYDQFLTTNANIVPTGSPLVFVPYVVSGGLAVLVAIVFFIFTFIPFPHDLVPKQTEVRTLKKIFSPGSCADGNIPFAIFLLTGLFLSYTIHVSRVHPLNLFLYPIAVETCSLQFSKTSATLLTTVYFTCATLGRISLGALSHFIPIKILLFIELTVHLGAYTGLYLLGLTSQLMLWIWVCSAVFFGSPIYPTMMAWADRYIEVTGLVVALIDTGIALGIFQSTVASGIIYQKYHSAAVLLYCLVCAAGLMACWVVMQIVAGLQGDRYKKQERQNKASQKDVENERTKLIN